jgi:hypothetical protein
MSTKPDLARIQAAFDQCEQDADKSIDRKAVAKLFKRLGQSVGKKELDRMVRSGAATRANFSCCLSPLALAYVRSKPPTKTAMAKSVSKSFALWLPAGLSM